MLLGVGGEMGEALMGESREGVIMIYQMEWAPCEGVELVAQSMITPVLYWLVCDVDPIEDEV